MKNIILFFLISIVISSCIFNSSDKKCLTDEDIANYIKVYNNLKKQAPSMLQEVNADKDADVAGKQGYDDFEKTVKDGGIADYAAFVKMNAKIGAVFSIMQANSFMEDMGEMTTDGMSQLDDATNMYDSLINDPNTPEAAKAEYRRAKEETQKGKQEISQNWEENKKWADMVLEKVNKISGITASECDVEMVKKHEKEIMESYTGFPAPATPE